MKRLLILTSCLLLLVMSGCQSNNTQERLLNDESERSEIYTAILENEQMRNELMVLMRERNMNGPRGGSMMQENDMVADNTTMGGMDRQQMQARMQEMMALCETDTAACNTMTKMMMQHRGMMGNMMQQMQQRGIMDSTCLQQMGRRMYQ